MTADPSFVLAGPDGAVVADGIHTAYPRLVDARAALSSGSTPIVLGALPFDMTRPAALMRPVAVRFADALPDWPSGPLPSVRIEAMMPDPDEHRARIRVALDRLQRSRQRAAESGVGARAAPGGRQSAGYANHVAPLVDRRSGGQRVSRRPDTGRRSVLGEGAPRRQPRVAGVAQRRPGRLQAVRGFGATTGRPGRRPGQRRGACAVGEEPPRARARRRRDAQSPRPVVRRLADSADAATEPHRRRLAFVHADNWTTSRNINDCFGSRCCSASDPGRRRGAYRAAAGLIGELEGDRGFYAGAVGWCDERGDGRWVVSIRGAQLSADRRAADAHAGGGIVAESDPDDEVAETTTKFTTILSALEAQ